MKQKLWPLHKIENELLIDRIEKEDVIERMLKEQNMDAMLKAAKLEKTQNQAPNDKAEKMVPTLHQEWKLYFNQPLSHSSSSQASAALVSSTSVLMVVCFLPSVAQLKKKLWCLEREFKIFIL